MTVETKEAQCAHVRSVMRGMRRAMTMMNDDDDDDDDDDE